MTQTQQEDINLLKELIADSSISAEERDIYEGALSELMQSEKPKASTERKRLINDIKPQKTTERKPRTSTQRKPQAPKQSKSDIESAKAEIKRRTGKTEEECESIVNEYRSLRAKSVERKKKESVASAENKDRVAKLKKDDKIISGTSEKTADAVIESTTKDVAEKIVKEIEKIEQKAEVEATKEVKKEMPKESATEQNKVIAEKTEEKVKEIVKTKTKNIIIDTSALLTSIAETLGKFDKDSQKVFLIKLRSDIDKLLTKFSYGGTTMGATQGYNITQSNLSSSSVNPTMFGGGGGVDNNKWKYLYFVQGSYGQGFEDLTAHENKEDAKAEMRVYDDNERYPHRVILRKVLTSDYEKGNYARGGGVRIGSDGREYPYGSAWALEHNSYNESEKHEVPTSERKFDEGGKITDADLNYYVYPNKIVKIAYLGKIQMGYHFSLKDAMKEIEYLTMASPKDAIEKYAIITPDKTFHLGEKEYPIRFDDGGGVGMNDRYDGKQDEIIAKLKSMKGGLDNNAPEVFMKNGDGLIYVSAENDDNYADYYENGYIDKQLEKLAEKYDTYWEFEDAGSIVLFPTYRSSKSYLSNGGGVEEKEDYFFDEDDYENN